MSEYVNLPTVVCALVPAKFKGVHGIIVIRRGLKDGYGQLALPGGFQEGKHGHSLHFTAHKEVLEETGIDIPPHDFRVVSAMTDEYGHNVVFMVAAAGVQLPDDHTFQHDHEILEVLLAHEPVESCYPLHTLIMRWWFTREEINYGPEALPLA